MKKKIFGKRRAFSLPQPIGYQIEKLIKPFSQSQGFCEARVLLDWPLIVGDFLASQTAPERIAFARGTRIKGTLYIRLPSALAPEIQHLSLQIIERINQYFGYQAVEKMTLLHGTVRKKEKIIEQSKQENLFSLPLEIEEKIAQIEDVQLQMALKNLYKYMRES